jgi:hypothetical protein
MYSRRIIKGIVIHAKRTEGWAMDDTSNSVGMEFGPTAAKTISTLKLNKFTTDRMKRARIVNRARDAFGETRKKDIEVSFGVRLPGQEIPLRVQVVIPLLAEIAPLQFSVAMSSHTVFFVEMKFAYWYADRDMVTAIPTTSATAIQMSSDMEAECCMR